MPETFIDLRSDTITQPTDQMRQAITAAPLGDDVMGEDPTINQLERQTAEILAKEAALYVPSGTMANQIALRTQTQPGDEIFIEPSSHICFYEAGAPAAISGVTCRFVDGQRGLFTADALKAAIRPADVHFPDPKLVCLENTHNRGGGSIWPLEQIAEVAAAARDAGLKMHLDGARLWNASAASGIAESEYAKHFDSVSVCFSKGLGAPVGSAIAGSEQFIARARRLRKMLGGGMRQAGVIAAGALFALENNRIRLAEDHTNAKHLAEALSQLPGIEIDVNHVETNILYFEVIEGDARELAEKFDAAGVKMFAVAPNRIRAVTSMAVTRADIDRAIEIMVGVMRNNK